MSCIDNTWPPESTNSVYTSSVAGTTLDMNSQIQIGGATKAPNITRNTSGPATAFGNKAKMNKLEQTTIEREIAEPIAIRFKLAETSSVSILSDSDSDRRMSVSSCAKYSFRSANFAITNAAKVLGKISSRKA
jgi:hypothetical protein